MQMTKDKQPVGNGALRAGAGGSGRGSPQRLVGEDPSQGLAHPPVRSWGHQAAPAWSWAAGGTGAASARSRTARGTGAAPARSQAVGGTGAAPARGIRHLPGDGPRALGERSSQWALWAREQQLSQAWRHTLKFSLSNVTEKSFHSYKYSSFFKFRGTNKHALLQPSYKYFAPLSPLLHNVENMFGTLKDVFQFGFVRNV